METRMRTGVLGRPRTDGAPPVQRRLAASGPQRKKKGRPRTADQAPVQPAARPQRVERVQQEQQSDRTETPNFRSEVLSTLNSVSETMSTLITQESRMGATLQSLSNRVNVLETTRPNRIQSQPQPQQLSIPSSSREESEPVNLSVQRETTTSSSSIYEPVLIHNRPISIARSNADRIVLQGDKLSTSNYSDWKSTVYNHLARIGLEILLAVPPNSENPIEIAMDREIFNAIRLNLEADVRAAVDRHKCKTSKELWTALETENSAMNSAQVTVNLRFVTGTKLQSLKDLTSHCMKFAAAIHQLEQTGHTFSEATKVQMFLATLSNHNQFHIHVQTYVLHNFYDLTQTYLHCQREAPVFLGKAANQQSVGNINKSGRFAHNNNTGWNNYSNRSRSNRLNPKNKDSNKFKANNQPPFTHMKRRREHFGNRSSNYDPRQNNSNNRNYSNSNSNSNSNSYPNNNSNRSNNNYRNNNSNNSNNSNNNWRHQRNNSNVRAITNQAANEESEQDDNQDDRQRMARAVSSAIRNAFSERPSGNRESNRRSNAAIKKVLGFGCRAIYLNLPYGCIVWILDSGADVHVTNDLKLLKNARQVNVVLGGYNGYTTIVEWVGEITLVLEDKKVPIILKDVHYVPSAEYNYISHTALEEDHLFVLTKSGAHLMLEDGGFATFTKVIEKKHIVQLHKQNIGSINSNRKLNCPVAISGQVAVPAHQSDQLKQFKPTNYAVTNVRNRLGDQISAKDRIRSYKQSCGTFTPKQRQDENYLPIQQMNYAQPIINRVYNVAENHLLQPGEEVDRANWQVEQTNWTKCTPTMFIHMLFNHTGKGVTKRICEENGYNFQDYQCESCQFHKFLNEIPRMRVNDPKHPFHVVHIDLIVNSVQGWDRSKFALVIVDDFSESSWLYTIEKKSQATEMFINWFSYVETQYGFPVKQVRTDNAKEFVDGDLLNFMKRMGSVYERTVPGHPNQNGVAENRIRTLKSKAECILDHVPAKHRDLVRPEALKHVAHMLNLTPFGPNTNLCPAAILGEVHVPQRFYRFYEPVYTELSKSSSNPDYAVGFEKHDRGYRVFNPVTKTVYRAASLRPVNGTKFKVNTYLDQHLN